MNVWWPLVSKLNRIASLVTPTIETPVGGDAPARVPPTYFAVDPYRGQPHNGSPDLEAFPPTLDELTIAGGVLDGVPGYAYDLETLCRSPERARAVLHRARIEQAAAAVIQRVTGGTP